MALISTKAHGILDYATGAAMLVAPAALRLRDRRAASVLWGAGASMVAASAMTDHEVALVRKLPMPLHVLLDAGAGLGLAIVPWAIRPRRGSIASWVPHAAFGIAEIAAAALTERRAASPVEQAPDSSSAPTEPPTRESEAPDAAPQHRAAPARPVRAEDRDYDALVAREARAAAAEAAMIGGMVAHDVDDPAMDPVYQAGGGEQDGWEAAEAGLIENATHGDGGADPLRDALAPELESDLSGAVYGEGDRFVSTELVEDPGTREEDPGTGPGLSAERGPGIEPRQGE